MPLITIETEINAPIEIVFDLARCIDLHERTMSKHNEKAIAGKTKGLIEAGETVTWEATHFGVRQKLTSKITSYNRPKHFRDSMVSGAFKSFDHDHFFTENEKVTTMKDVFNYESPLGLLGVIANKLFLKKYMNKLLTNRNELIKKTAESGDWRKYLER